MGGKKLQNVKISVLALLLLAGSVNATTLTDPTGDWFTGSNGNPATGYDYTDIISANIEQIDSTTLKATIVVNANIPSFGWHGYRWFLDTDRSTSTGQTGYLFNDIGVDYWVQVSGSSGVPNPDVGVFRNGVGKIKTLTNYIVQGNKVEITFSPSDIGNPDSFYWIADSTDGVSVNDHASNSGHGTVTLSPSQPSNYFTVSNLNMNGQGNYIEVNAGATISGTVSYTIWDSSCPGCIKQLVIGLDNDPKTCIFDSIPGAYPGKSGTVSFSFTALTSPGTYTVGWTEDAMYGCSDAKNNYPGKSKSTLGTVKVNAPQVTTGSIYVTSTPSGASIYLDGSYQSTTPYTINNVPAGSHTITLKLSGYQDGSTTVNVVAGQTSTVSASLTQPITTGSIAVSSTPSDASIYLDGSYQTTTPYTITNVQAGSHTITLKLNGYQDWSTTVNVVAGQTSSVSTQLIQTSPKYALALYVYDSKTSDRLEGAKVYVDNSLKATIDRYGSPDPNVYLLPATYSIRISKDGCTDASFSVAIPLKDTKYVAMNCKAQQNQQPTIVTVTYSKPVEAGSQPPETEAEPNNAVTKPNDELMSRNSAIRANIYAGLVDQWQNPEGKMLKNWIVEPLLNEIFLESIGAFMPDNTYTDLISSINDLKDKVEEKPWWSSLWGPTKEEMDRFVAMEYDYHEKLKVPYYELQTKEVPLHSTLRKMKKFTEEESQAWKSCFLGISILCSSNPEKAKNILKNEKENINDLKKLLSWSIEMEKSAETDEYKTLIKLTKNFLSEEIDYLQSVD